MIKQDTTTRKTLWEGKEMRIFGLVIMTKRKLKEITDDIYKQGLDDANDIDVQSVWSAINPVIHSLKELRKNTWDVERVDQAINWLKDNFEVQDDD